MTQAETTVPRITLQCTCTGQTLSRNDSTTLVQGQVAKVAVALGVTEEWGNLITVARFRHEGSLAIYDIEIDDNYEVEIPHEMTDDTGSFSMSLRGEGDDRVITSSPVSFTVTETITGLGKTSEPTETILDRFSSASKKAEENAALAESYSKSASASATAAAQSESNAKTYSESAKSSETVSADNATKTQSLLDEAKRLDRFHVNYLTKTTESNTFVHVEDAFEGGRIRGFTIKGAYSQTTTTGANLWPQIESLKMDGVTFEPYANRDGHADRGMVKISGTPTLANRCASVEVSLESGTYSFKNFGYYKGSSATDAGAVYLRVRAGSDEYTAFGSEVTSFTISEAATVNLDIMTGAIGTFNPGVIMPILSKGLAMPSVWEEYSGGNPSPSPDYPQEVHLVEKCDVCVYNANSAMQETVSSDTVDGSEIVSTTSISLPEEHPYLAALPDGSCDVIMVDEDGHASIVSRIGRETINLTWRFDTTGGGNAIYKTINNIKGNFGALTERAYPKYGYLSNRSFSTNANLYIIDTTAKTVEEIVEIFGNGAFIYYALETPITYDLGYIDMPLQPDRYCNILIDSGDDYALPELSVTYERDINIVVSELESHLTSE